MCTMKNIRSKYLIMLVWLLFATNFAKAQSNLVLFISSSGDYIGQGQTYITENQGDFNVSGTPATITISAFGFGFTFAGPGDGP
jgi:hypothetical protein